jgi:hypothetical protein
MVLPVMTFLYGLGSMDRYFLEGGAGYLDNVRRTAQWMLANLLPEGYFDNRWQVLQPTCDFYSNNGAMTQGLALSFAVRAIQHDLLDPPTAARMQDLVHKVAANTLLPLERQGTAVYEDRNVFFLEFCRKDHNVVLNGWIFAVFGLLDYRDYSRDEHVRDVLQATLTTMKAALPSYRLPNGWSYYDNRQRLSSPFYQGLHVSLLEALHLLTGDPLFQEYAAAFRRANHRWNQARYTLTKIKDKVFDRELHCTQRGSSDRQKALSSGGRS